MGVFSRLASRFTNQTRGDEFVYSFDVRTGGTGFEPEKNPQLRPPERYKTYSRMRAIPIVAAFQTQFNDSVGQLTFSFGGRNQDAEARRLLGPLLTPEALRVMAQSTTHGFSLIEFATDTVGRIVDWIPIPQQTIDRFNVDGGDVVSFEQRVGGQRIVLPRETCAYSVNGRGVHGHGLFQDCAQHGIGWLDNRQRVLEAADVNARRRPNFAYPTDATKKAQDTFTKVIHDRNQTAATRYVISSEPYESVRVDASTQVAAAAKRWEILYPPPIDLAAADVTTKLTQDIATVLGMEAYVLGQVDVGSRALAEVQSDSFITIVRGAIANVERVLYDVLRSLYVARGRSNPPEPVADTIELPDPEMLATVMQTLRGAGAEFATNSAQVEYVLERAGLPTEIATTEEADDGDGNA